MRSAIHDIRNHLTVAMAVVEALADGKMEPTAVRLNGTYHALQEVDALIDGLVSAKSQHVRSTIHEIRNHLTVAMAVIEILADGKMQPTVARLNGTHHALQEVDALTNELATSQQTERATRVEQIDICGLIGKELDAIEALAVRHGVSLSVVRCEHVSANCARFFGEPLRIAEIVTNVLTNAILYTRPGGTVEVDCRREGADLLFSVRDEGPGVADNERTRIFELGYRGTASGNTAGSGFGLAIAKQFVERHGGTIEVENRAQRGAAFTVRLPTTSRLFTAGGMCTGCVVDAHQDLVCR
jgi:signal transduction histidine kinase